MRRDFNPVDISYYFFPYLQMSCLFCFLSCVSRHASRVKEWSCNHPLLIKPYEPFSSIRLSSGISHSRRQIVKLINPPDLVFSSYSTIFMNFARWRFHLLSGGYLSGILLSVCCYRAVNRISIQTRTPSLGHVYPSIQSPPVSIDSGSVCHWHDLHCYYGFIRLLIMHCSGFPVRLYLGYLYPLS